MKIRTGFVSNSSSASFIIGNAIIDPLLVKAVEAVRNAGYEEDPTIISIKDVALEMFKSSDRNDHIKWLDKLSDNVKLLTFASCNYETEIMALDDGSVMILTCNNEQDAWEPALNILSNRYNREWQNIEESNLYDDLVYAHPCHESFEELYEELDEEYSTYFTFNMVEFSKIKGPAAYIGENGIALYENGEKSYIK